MSCILLLGILFVTDDADNSLSNILFGILFDTRETERERVRQKKGKFYS